MHAGPRPLAPPPPAGFCANLLPARLAGAQIRLVPRARFAAEGQEALLEHAAQELRAQGRTPYIIPIGCVRRAARCSGCGDAVGSRVAPSRPPLVGARRKGAEPAELGGGDSDAGRALGQESRRRGAARGDWEPRTGGADERGDTRPGKRRQERRDAEAADANVHRLHGDLLAEVAEGERRLGEFGAEIAKIGTVVGYDGLAHDPLAHSLAERLVPERFVQSDRGGVRRRHREPHLVDAASAVDASGGFAFAPRDKSGGETAASRTRVDSHVLQERHVAPRRVATVRIGACGVPQLAPDDLRDADHLIAVGLAHYGDGVGARIEEDVCVEVRRAQRAKERGHSARTSE